jgi:hypothetical protein
MVDRGSIPRRDREEILSFLRPIQVGSRTQSSSCPIGIGGSYPGVKAAGA